MADYLIDQFLRKNKSSMSKLAADTGLDYHILKKYRKSSNLTRMQFITAYKIAKSLNLPMENLYKEFEKIEMKKLGAGVNEPQK